MDHETTSAAERALSLLAGDGLLMLQDAALPSLVGLVVGAPVGGSWWGHPKGDVIFRAAGVLDDHVDVTTTKLISGKVTFVHRWLWPAVVAVGAERAPWQLRGLSAAGQALLAAVDLREEHIASGKAAKELEGRLLVHTRQVHTASGAHATALSTWEAFSVRAQLGPSRLSPDDGRERLAERAAAWAATYDAPARVPWSR